MSQHKTGLFVLIGFLACLIVFPATYAVDAVGISAGFGEPNSLVGGRIAVQWAWKHMYRQHETDAVGITGYWDASAAYWHTQGDVSGNHKNIAIFAFAPIFRVQAVRPLWHRIYPYIEGGIGGAYMTAKNLGKRGLGSHWTFQDLIGLGFQFGDHQQYDLSYHFLHYSNASFAMPNSGVYVKALVSFVYHFSAIRGALAE